MGEGSASFTPQLGTACQIKSAKAHALSCCTVVGCCLPACLPANMGTPACRLRSSDSNGRRMIGK